MSGKSTKKYNHAQVIAAVIDANVLLAALLRDSMTRELLLDDRLALYAPENLISESERHLVASDRLRRRLHLTLDELRALFTSLTAKIKIVPEENYMNYLRQARRSAPHPEDAPYLALALHLDLSLWSNDKGMKQQQEVEIMTTQGLIRLLK